VEDAGAEAEEENASVMRPGSGGSHGGGTGMGIWWRGEMIFRVGRAGGGGTTGGGAPAPPQGRAPTPRSDRLWRSALIPRRVAVVKGVRAGGAVATGIAGTACAFLITELDGSKRQKETNKVGF